MHIQKDKLNQIIEYCLSVKKSDTTKSKQSVDHLNETLQFIHDELNSVFNLNEIASAIMSDKLKDNVNLQRKLDQFISCLDSMALQNNGEYKFDIHQAKKIAGQIQYRAVPDMIHDISDKEQLLGLREMFVSQKLDSTTPITEIDVKRFLYESGIYDNVHVATMDQDILGGIFTDIAKFQQDEIEPYTINLLLMRNNSASYWIAAKINIDPFKRSINYNILNNINLNDDEQSFLMETLSTAIRTGYSSDELWRITSADIITRSKKQETSSSALFALYNILQDPNVLDDSELATTFANTTLDSELLYKQFLSAQLQTLKITPKIYNELSSEMKSNFMDYQIKKDILNSVI